MNTKSLLSTFALVVLALVAWIGIGLVVHDVLGFSAIRAQVDQQLAQASYVEWHPSDDVRRTFSLDESYFISQIAFGLYRSHLWSLPEKERSLFPPAKFLAVQMWAVQLNFWYRRSELETYRIHSGCYDDDYGLGGCDEVSIRLFGKPLNYISERQLACIGSFYRSRSQHACPELAALLRNSHR